jgi:hypothetical protein
MSIRSVRLYNKEDSDQDCDWTMEQEIRFARSYVCCPRERDNLILPS